MLPHCGRSGASLDRVRCWRPANQRGRSWCRQSRRKRCRRSSPGDADDLDTGDDFARLVPRGIDRYESGGDLVNRDGDRERNRKPTRIRAAKENAEPFE